MNTKRPFGCFKGPQIKTSRADRFWMKVDKSSSTCWIWLATIHATGYGTFWDLSPTTNKGTMRLAHRVAWEMANNERLVDETQHVLHKCDNRRCVNPEHLWLGTALENALDAKAKGRLTHGEKHIWAKLNDEKVQTVRELWEGGKFSMRSLGRKFGVHHTVISDAINKRSWAHV